MAGNTVGSRFFFETAEDFYILGLWLADGYRNASAIGLTSVTPQLIDKFEKFLLRIMPNYPIRRRIYQVDGKSKRKQTCVQIYLNNRPLTRLFMSYKTGDLSIPPQFLPAYLAGRIDGDGHVDTKHRSGIRIAYGSRVDAARDQKMFGVANASLYTYTAARTYVLYLKKQYREEILPKLAEFSLKLCPVETVSD